MQNPQTNTTAIQQVIETFGSEAELLELFDNLLHRMTLAYAGNPQPNYFLVGDYDFLHQLRQAIKQDLQNACPAPHYRALPTEDHSHIRPLTRPKPITSIEQAIAIAEAKGITDFRAVKLQNEYALFTNWTQQDVKAYQESVGKLWGNFSDEGVFIIRFLHLMQDNQENL
ncbi:hypothetical protein [Microscilla marina]|uniref:Uncharacterized protein n=1 Tax=Microscilla marina ATCC 23134 TaxID=313606 RepID=A1ZLM4_MICM2|nr:hypothetical protein [Microscilla marina]EAY28778.1 hypothetical protein M23134_07876 [Microscilla marina ATCC 23134]